MKIVELLEARVHTYSNDILVCNHCYQQVATSRLELSDATEYVKVLMRGRKSVA